MFERFFSFLKKFTVSYKFLKWFLVDFSVGVHRSQYNIIPVESSGKKYGRIFRKNLWKVSGKKMSREVLKETLVDFKSEPSSVISERNFEKVSEGVHVRF